jgi:hypothetical protein
VEEEYIITNNGIPILSIQEDEVLVAASEKQKKIVFDQEAALVIKHTSDEFAERLLTVYSPIAKGKEIVERTHVSERVTQRINRRVSASGAVTEPCSDCPPQAIA